MSEIQTTEKAETLITNEATPVITATHTQIMASAWICQILFADHVPGPAPETVVTHARVAVMLPWPMTKVLHHMLEQVIRDYEEREGEISLPKSIDFKTIRK